MYKQCRSGLQAMASSCGVWLSYKFQNEKHRLELTLYLIEWSWDLSNIRAKNRISNNTYYGYACLRSSWRCIFHKFWVHRQLLLESKNPENACTLGPILYEQCAPLIDKYSTPNILKKLECLEICVQSSSIQEFSSLFVLPSFGRNIDEHCFDLSALLDICSPKLRSFIVFINLDHYSII